MNNVTRYMVFRNPESMVNGDAFEPAHTPLDAGEIVTSDMSAERWADLYDTFTDRESAVQDCKQDLEAYKSMLRREGEQYERADDALSDVVMKVRVHHNGQVDVLDDSAPEDSEDSIITSMSVSTIYDKCGAELPWTIDTFAEKMSEYGFLVSIYPVSAFCQENNPAYVSAIERALKEGLERAVEEGEQSEDDMTGVFDGSRPGKIEHNRALIHASPIANAFRDRGSAVVFYSRSDLRGVDPDTVLDRMRQSARQAAEALDRGDYPLLYGDGDGDLIDHDNMMAGPPTKPSGPSFG